MPESEEVREYTYRRAADIASEDPELAASMLDRYLSAQNDRRERYYGEQIEDEANRRLRDDN